MTGMHTLNCRKCRVTLALTILHRSIINFKSNCSTHVDVNALLVEHLQPRPLVGHVAVELGVVLVPLDRVERLALEVELADEGGVGRHADVGGHVDTGQADGHRAWKGVIDIFVLSGS